MVSQYYWMRSRYFPNITLDAVFNLHALNNWRILSIDNRLAVDAIVRFEHLHSDFSAVCDRIGLPRPAELPRLKTGIRPSAVDYRDLFTTRQADKIARLCHREIELFGYAFDPR